MHNRRGGDPHPLGGDSDEGPLPNSHHFLGSDFFCYANLISSRIWLARVDLAAVRGVTFPRLCYVKRMYSPAFERQKWEKRHDFLIEQFDPVNIRDILGYIPARHVNNRLPWSPSNHPHLTVIPRRCGCMVRWFFLCPACGRRCEDLFDVSDSLRFLESKRVYEHELQYPRMDSWVAAGVTHTDTQTFKKNPKHLITIH